MFEKILNTIGIVFIVIGCICAGLNSCATRPVVVATDESIVGSQISAARIEAINREIRDLLSVYDGFIGAEIGRAGEGIDTALDALDRYDEFVQGLISRVREIELATRIGEGESQDQE